MHRVGYFEPKYNKEIIPLEEIDMTNELQFGIANERCFC
jgi:hypothetical protein